MQHPYGMTHLEGLYFLTKVTQKKQLYHFVIARLIPGLNSATIYLGFQALSQNLP